MFLLNNKNIRSKNYNIIIVPEKYGSSKVFNLSLKDIKIAASLVIIIVTCILIFFGRYYSVSKKVLQTEQNEKIINSLKCENEDKQKNIDNYMKYQIQINNKLKELEKLENDVKNKMKSSITLKDTSMDTAISSNNKTYSRGGAIDINKDENLIKDLDSEIKKYADLSKEIDSVLNKEKYIISFMPCQGNISSYFGYRKNPFNGGSKDFHPGIDIAGSYGSKIYAAAGGTITLAGGYGGYGNAVVIDHHNGYETVYGHTSKIYVIKGKNVEKGELIALVGSTGSSTGPHLHFEVRKNGTAIDPLKILRGED